MTLRPGQKFTDRSIIGLLEPRLEVQRSVILKTAQGQIGPRFLNFMADMTVIPVPLVPRATESANPYRMLYIK